MNIARAICEHEEPHGGLTKGKVYMVINYDGDAIQTIDDHDHLLYYSIEYFKHDESGGLTLID